MLFYRSRAACFTKPPLKQVVDKTKWIQEISWASRMNYDCELQEPDLLLQRCFLAVTTIVDNQRLMWSCVRINCVWFWVVYFDLHIPTTAAHHFCAHFCLYPVQFQWDNTVVKQSRIWHIVLTKLSFKQSLCAILMWCLHVMDLVVCRQMWLFAAQTCEDSTSIKSGICLCCIFLNLSFYSTFISSEDFHRS